jgi:iron(III) transport system ATP-binding protein
VSVLKLRGVSKRFGATVAVSDATLDVEAGSKTAIVGPSGCGKTTLLRLIGGFETPDTGTITLDNVTLADDARAMPAHLRGIGYVPQEGALFPHLTVNDNIGFSLAGTASERRRRIEQLMGLVELDPSLGKRWPHEVSGGQQQRVALARALASRPRVVLLDEPFSALNAQLRAATRAAVSRLLGAIGVTLILVTHDQEEALSFADQLVVMRDGRLVQVGTPVDVYRRPTDAAAARMLGDAIVIDAELSGGYAISPIGLIPTDHNGADGPRQIMIRPSQLALAGRNDEGAIALFKGVVVGREFRGDFYVLSISVASEGGERSDTSTELSIRCSVDDAPMIDDRVGISMRGQAHVLK